MRTLEQRMLWIVVVGATLAVGFWGCMRRAAPDMKPLAKALPDAEANDEPELRVLQPINLDSDDEPKNESVEETVEQPEPGAAAPAPLQVEEALHSSVKRVLQNEAVESISPVIDRAATTEESVETVVGEAKPQTLPMVDLEAMRKQIEARRKAEAEVRAEDPTWRTSHEEASAINVGDDLSPGSLHNFCLHVDGTLLACCGRIRRSSQPGATVSPFEGGQIRVLGTGGELLGTWELDFVPQAIAVLPDGTVFVGGDGRLAKLDRHGKVLAMADSPALAKDEPEPKKEAEAPGEEAVESKSILGVLIQALGGESSTGQGARAATVKRRLRTITGIAVTEQDLFVATPMSKGYGYAVWRMDHDFGNPKQVVTKLSGCCGQMDIQTHNGELWIPENGRHRVTRYDREGNVLASFGRRNRKAAEGFGGCCEPKNLRFGPDGHVYTAESGPPVVVKRFSPEGQFLGVVGLPVFKTGCVRVTVEVSRDGSRVYVLHGSGNTIHVLEEKPLQPTHVQISTIPISQDKPGSVRTFCLRPDGSLLVACGGDRATNVGGENGATEVKIISEPAEIKVLDPGGKPLGTWTLDVTPQAINVDPDGTVYVGGAGRLAKLDKQGNVLQVADSPNVAELGPIPSGSKPDETPGDEKEAEEKKEHQETQEAKQAKINQANQKLQEAVAALQEASRAVSATAGHEKSQPAAKKKYNQALSAYAEARETVRELTTPPKVLASQRRAAAIRKRVVTGIAATEKDVFVACPAAKGFGYDVWRTDHEFGNPKKIVTGLRGCCGQMDIQAHDGELFVAENSRGRVVRYDRDGNELATWGKKDRKDVKSFGSCCNPMNVRIGPGGEVYTSESNLGRIKRFSPEGALLDLVGTVELVPGCKHVPIGINADASRIYLLDITRSHIAVLAPREAAVAQQETPAAAGAGMLAEATEVSRESGAKAAIRRLTSALSARRKYRVAAAKVRLNTAKAQIGLLRTPLELYHLHVGEYPTTEQGLAALREAPGSLANAAKWDGPYLSKDVPLDPWGNPYHYQSPGKHNPGGFDLWSQGPDRIDGTEDDLGNWERK